MERPLEPALALQEFSAQMLLTNVSALSAEALFALASALETWAWSSAIFIEKYYNSLDFLQIVTLIINFS